MDGAGLCDKGEERVAWRVGMEIRCDRDDFLRDSRDRRRDDPSVCGKGSRLKMNKDRATVDTYLENQRSLARDK